MVAPATTTANAQPNNPRQRPTASYPSYGHNVPLSARRSAPLDLSTVERRGQPSATREPTNRVRAHGLPEAPTFRPTEEEFRDPNEYIRKIAPEGSKYGICRIIPPENWNPPFAVDTERFHFKTRRQELNSVEGGTRANLNYLDQLAKFHKQHGTNLNRFPSVDKRPLDLYKLKKAVEVRGGFDQVCKLKKWAEIGRDLGYSGKIMSSLSTSLKNSYQRWLQPYEEYLRVAKPGVQQQLEVEQGGPYTPSPNRSPVAKRPMSATPSNARQESPAIRASNVLNASIETDNVPPEQQVPTSEIPLRPTAGFTAVNRPGGFTPVNRSPSFAVANNTPPIKRENENGSSTPKSIAPHPGKDKFDAKQTPLTNGHSAHPLKRTISHDSLAADSQSDTLELDASGRRSKRLRKDGVPTVAGSHMSLLRPTPPKGKSKGGTRRTGEKCEACGKTDNPETIFVCDSCENGYHKACLENPLNADPDYDWHCPKCLVGTGEFGFEEGGVYSLKQFQEKANAFKKSYFAPRMPFDPVLNTQRRETEDDVEREFWRLVESLTETVEVEYGADIHSTTHGSGFPTVERNPLDPYSQDPWNLNVLPFYGDSLFRHIKSDISGMTVPWVYVGMCFSTFCWHNEDHYAYSANYQHFGATKTWYGIPGKDAEAFEEAMRQAVPELFETQPDLLFQLVTLLPPDQLKKAGVNVYALDQRAGQFVITFPQAYHAGFNHGFNFNEAVNFAPTDWEPFARDTSIKTAKWLAPALDRAVVREESDRASFFDRHRGIVPHQCKFSGSDWSSDGDCKLKYVVDEEDLPEEEYQCHYCKAYAYLTQFRCDKSGKTVCLIHADMYDCCDEPLEQRMLGPNHTLRYRMTNDSLSALVQKIQDRARIPEAWTEKLDKVLEDEAKPQLKVLHSLLSEGEKIPYHLPGLQDLAAFVQRCDKWVEEANNYITRKQQNRRKNEKAWRKGTSKAAQLEERDRELRRVENIRALLSEADILSFDCPQMAALKEKTHEIEKFRLEVHLALSSNVQSATQIEELVETSQAVHYVQLEALSAQASRFPVSPETLAQVEAILTKQRDAQNHIRTLYERSKDPDIRKRPTYKEVRELMESLEQLNSRPIGAIDLEREQKHHEDWMRKGKKLFGKANAPLHILKSYMEVVEKKNASCFDLDDRFRPPVEPSSRDNTPDRILENPSTSWFEAKSRKRDVFCICRLPESGMMIECELCHEWYHGKCLKIARGKVKEFDKYTCPICDWRRKIPRDAARPKLEDLQDWQAEIATLPFQPDEEEVLNSIVKQATQFREFLQGFTNAACTTSEEVPTLIFYLRKIEGAEVLLAYETNFFRQEIHKWAPVAPDPPPILEQSLSTRKPRPTKSQKIMAQLGVDRVEDLPPHLRPKTSQAGKRKSMDATQPGRAPQPGSSSATDYQPDTPGDNGTSLENSSTPFFSGSYANLGQDSSPSFRLSSTPEPGPALLAHASGHSTTFPSRGSPHGLDQPLFSGPSVFRDPQETAQGVGIDTGNPFGSSPPRQEMTDVFADLTNDDPEAVEPMENTHANEALEALDVSNGSERQDSNNEGDGDISGPGDDVENHDRDGDGF
ncbi:hypothetical protein ZTR_02263 [Talaromyces verruculosus]|nr:hypothetical protein ZTR_02263 [Talaromyces verruculosus]